MDTDIAQRFERAIREDGRFSPAAFEFLHRGLEHTTRHHFAGTAAEGARHVTGQQLCHGLRDLALKTWGALAQTVLNGWNIRRTRDFGEMVFLLIALELMRKQDSDCIEDFDEVYDFDDAFGSYDIPLDKFDSQN